MSPARASISRTHSNVSIRVASSDALPLSWLFQLNCSCSAWVAAVQCDCTSLHVDDRDGNVDAKRVCVNKSQECHHHLRAAASKPSAFSWMLRINDLARRTSQGKPGCTASGTAQVAISGDTRRCQIQLAFPPCRAAARAPAEQLWWRGKIFWTQPLRFHGQRPVQADSIAASRHD